MAGELLQVFIWAVFCCFSMPLAESWSSREVNYRPYGMLHLVGYAMALPLNLIHTNCLLLLFFFLKTASFGTMVCDGTTIPPNLEGGPLKRSQCLLLLWAL